MTLLDQGTKAATLDSTTGVSRILPACWGWGPERGSPRGTARGTLTLAVNTGCRMSTDRDDKELYQTSHMDLTTASLKSLLSARKIVKGSTYDMTLDRQLSRSPADLLMNSTEDTRLLREEKEVMEYSRVLGPPDPFRGGPDFWKTPETLKTRACDDLGVTYPLQMTKVDRGIVPTMKYVDVPTALRREKEVQGGTNRRTAKDVWDQSEYLEQKRTELRETIQLVERHKPLTCDLVVEGRVPAAEEVRTKITVPEVPVLTVSNCAEHLEEPWRLEEDPENTVVLKVGETVLKRRTQSRSKARSPVQSKARFVYWGLVGSFFPEKDKVCLLQASGGIFPEKDKDIDQEFSWRILFTADVETQASQTLRFENLGTVKICYSWHRAPLATTMLPLTNHLVGGPFFFNKNDGIFLPGQIITFPFWFHSRSPGIFLETWELRTVPRLAEEGRSHLVYLWGSATSPDRTQEWKGVSDYLEGRVKEAAVQRVVDEMVARTRPVPPPEPTCRSLFLEEELFLHSNPGYFYHPSVVDALRTLHDQVVTDGRRWDLDLKGLREHVLTRVSGDKQQECLDVFGRNVAVLLTPCYMATVVSQKSRTVYSLLCGLANSVEDEGEALKAQFGLTSSVRSCSSSTTPVPDRPVRLSDKMDTRKTSAQDRVKSRTKREKMEVRGKQQIGGKLSQDGNSKGSSKVRLVAHHDTPCITCCSSSDTLYNLLLIMIHPV
uniref:(California timema) hypothetical protein n=1 Tax=Timema californicum TaxID=61474 RepID=A0A7R9JDT0_TIMCA|nr:unnamed protein product [Timema californicum]